MCQGCWEEAGSPSIVNEKTKRAAKLIAKVYEYHGAGGNAHIVVDDWNVSDDSIQFCLKNLKSESIRQRAAEKACLEALLVLSVEERYSALAIHDGFVYTNQEERKAALQNLHAFSKEAGELAQAFYIKRGFYPNVVVIPERKAEDLMTWQQIVEPGQTEPIGGIQTYCCRMWIEVRPGARGMDVEFQRGRGM